MKKAIFIILILISTITLLVRFGGLVFDKLFIFQNIAGVKILSNPPGAEVYIDGQSLGNTPFERQELEAKEYIIRINGADGHWQGKVQLQPGTLTVVNRDLTKDATSLAGEILNLKKGEGVTIISTPDGAEVEIDGKIFGKTPLLVEAKSGDHTFVLSKNGYLKRSIRAQIPEGFNLFLTVDLALSEADLTSLTTPPISITPTLLVKDTPTGFLRVRDKPALNGKEVARASPGNELVLLEQSPSWFKVRLSNGQEGYVSASYVEKVNP